MPLRLIRPVLALIVLLAIALPLASDQSDELVVVSAVGKWVQYPNASTNPEQLVWGQTLQPPGYVCGSAGNSIVLAKKAEIDKTFPFTCDKSARDSRSRKCLPPPPAGCGCAVCLVPSTLPEPRGIVQALKEVFQPLLLKGPDRYMIAVSRGVEEELVDSVVLISANGVDLSPAFREMDSGQYWVTLSQVDRTSAPSSPLQLQYKHGSPAPVTFPSIEPGLYKVLIVDQSGEPAGSDCWILARAPESYSSTSSQFERARDQESKWPAEVDPSVARGLLRAYLESLGSMNVKKP